MSTSKRELAKQFIEDLQDTLDVELTIKKLKITEADARDILREMAARLFGAAVVESPKSSRSPLSLDSVVIHVDGASRGNPGLAGAGAILKDTQGRVVKKLRRFLGEATNNVAEYEALLMSLEEAQALGCKSVKVFADSELVVKQIKGIYRVKNASLKIIYVKVMKVVRTFDKFTISHVMREKNSEADKLANEAIDGVK